MRREVRFRGRPGAQDGIAAALQDAARGYERLASAARRDDRGDYRTAARAVRTAEAELQRALARLGRLGYRVG